MCTGGGSLSVRHSAATAHSHWASADVEELKAGIDRAGGPGLVPGSPYKGEAAIGVSPHNTVGVRAERRRWLTLIGERVTSRSAHGIVSSRVALQARSRISPQRLSFRLVAYPITAVSAV